VPPEDTVSKPPLLIVVPLVVPPDSTTWSPALLTVVLVADP
jgi:hypothetical protein